jgi:hypothetical protein
LTARILRARTISTVTSKEDREMQEARMRFPFLTLAAATLLHAANGPALAQDTSERLESAGARTMITSASKEKRIFHRNEYRIPDRVIFPGSNRAWLTKSPSDQKVSNTNYGPEEPCAGAMGNCPGAPPGWKNGRYRIPGDPFNREEEE